MLFLSMELLNHYNEFRSINIEIFLKIKWGAFSHSSFRPDSTWGSIKTTTIGKTHTNWQNHWNWNYYLVSSEKPLKVPVILGLFTFLPPKSLKLLVVFQWLLNSSFTFQLFSLGFEYYRSVFLGIQSNIVLNCKITCRTFGDYLCDKIASL